MSWINTYRTCCFALSGFMLLACGSGGGGLEGPKPNPTPTIPQPTFAQSGLQGKIVNHLLATESTVYAATDAGVYLFEDDQWQLRSQADWQVLDIVRYGERHLLISAKQKDKSLLAESKDDGLSWEILTHNFSDMSGEPAFRLVLHQGKLYGVGYDVLAVSEDRGRNWRLLAGGWNGFARGMSALTVHPSKPDVWYGGQGAIENIILRKLDIETLAEENYPDIVDLLPAPSVVKSIVMHPTDPERVFITGEGGLIQSSDYGQSWQVLRTNDNYRFYFGLLLDSQDPDVMYTAGWSKDYDNPQSLILEISRDGGKNWQNYQHPDSSLFGGVYSMASRREQGKEVLYLGLYKGGVMKVVLE